MSNSQAGSPGVLFITGAASGMGQLAARRALDDGWRVAALDINTEGLDALGEAEQLLKLTVDVADADQIRDAVKRTEAAFGPITRAVHSAAIMPLGLTLDQSPEFSRKMMGVNFHGLVNVAHAVLPAMLSRGAGEFVSFASAAGLVPMYYIGDYNASKFACVAYTEVLANENHGKGVNFCCVCPPMVATPLLDWARKTTWPKIFDLLPPLKPETVLDQIERALAKGRFWVLPGPFTRLVWWVRRALPGPLWWFNRWIERRAAAKHAKAAPGANR